MRTFKVELKQKQNLGPFCKDKTGFKEKKGRKSSFVAISPKTLREKIERKLEKEKKGRKKKEKNRKKKRIGKKIKFSSLKFLISSTILRLLLLG